MENIIFEQTEEGIIVDLHIADEGKIYHIAFPKCSGIRIGREKRFPKIAKLTIIEPEDAENFEIEIANESFPDLFSVDIVKENNGKTWRQKYLFDRTSECLVRYDSKGSEGTVVNCWNSLSECSILAPDVTGASNHAFDGTKVTRIYCAAERNNVAFKAEKGYIKTSRGIILTDNVYEDCFTIEPGIVRIEEVGVIRKDFGIFCDTLVVDSNVNATGIGQYVKQANKLVISGESRRFNGDDFSSLLLHCRIREIICQNPNFFVKDEFVYEAGSDTVVLCPIWKEYFKVPEGTKCLADWSCYACYADKKNWKGVRVELPASMTYISKVAFIRTKFLKLHGPVRGLGEAISFPCTIELENGYRIFIPAGMREPFYEEHLKWFTGTQAQAERMEADILQMCRGKLNRCEYLFFQFQEQRFLSDGERNTLKRNAIEFFDYLLKKDRNQAFEFLKSGFFTKPKIKKILEKAEENHDTELAAYAIEMIKEKPKASFQL